MKCLTGLIFILLLFPSLETALALNGIPLAFRGGYASHRLWQNVEAEPEWAGGVRPASRFFSSIHTVTLKPGEFVLVRIPPREKLKVVMKEPDDDDGDSSFTPDALRLSVSDGSGLYAFLPVSFYKEEYALVLEPGRDRPMTARIERPVCFRRSLTAAISVSRTETPKGFIPYRKPVDLPGPSVGLQNIACPMQKEDIGTFTRMKPDTPVEISIRGPVRLKLEHRLIYPPKESRRDQTYRIRASLDEGPPRTLLTETLPDTDNPPRLKDEVFGNPFVPGRRENDFIDVPDGSHVLTLSASAEILLRILTPADSDYLLPRLNAPKRDGDDEEIGQRIEKETEAALMTAGNNRIREGGLTGAARMRNLSNQYPDHEDLRKSARKLFGMHSFYRNLFPFEKEADEPVRFCRFIPRHLRPIRTVGEQTPGAPQHREALLDAVAGAYFAEVHDVSVYHIPERIAPGMLRLAAWMPDGGTADFELQMDGGERIRFRQGPTPEFPREDYALSPGDMGLALSRMLHPEDGAGTLGGPYSAERTPAPLVSAGIFELPLAPDVETVRLKRTDEKAGRLMLALQYRASSANRASEREYFALLRRLGPSVSASDLFLRQLSAYAEGSDEGFPSERESVDTTEEDLVQQWIPLTRLIGSRAAAYASGVSPAPDVPRPHKLESSEIQVLIQKAEKYQSEGFRVNALEIWTEIFHGSEGQHRLRAGFERAELLRLLGEHDAAERMLKETLLFSGNEAETEQAFRMLRNTYEKEKDLTSLTALSTLALLTERKGFPPVSESLRALSRCLNEEGGYRDALLLNLMLPASERDAETLIRAAWHERWRQTMENHFPLLKSEEEAGFWKGLSACREGEYREARNFFRSAGAKGRVWLEFLEKGEGIRQALSASGDRAAPAGAEPEALILRWMDWEKNHPGPRIRKSAAHLVTDYAEAHTVYSVSRDLYGTAFAGEPERPVKLRIAGPAVLRGEIRPLHEKDAAAESLEGWISLKSSDGLHFFPVNRNLTSDAIRMADRGDRIPGRRVFMEYRVPPGIHEIEVNSRKFPILAQFDILQPDIRLNVLPPLTPETLAFALKTHPEDREAFGFAFSVSEAEEICGRKRVRLPSSGETEAAPGPAPDADADDDSIFRYMGRLCRTGEQLLKEGPEAAGFGEVLAEAERVFAAYSRIPGLKSLYIRTVRGSRWSASPFVQSGAGIRYSEISGWMPRSRGLRIHKALMPPFEKDEFALYDAETVMIFYLTGPEPTELELMLKAEDAGTYPPAFLTAFWQLDEREGNRVRLLSGEEPLLFQVPVPAGEHALRVQIEKRMENQYLRVRAAEKKSSREIRPFLTETRQRFWHAATREEPVIFEIQGPAWVRIDELREGRTGRGDILSRYRKIASGWQTLKLEPKAGQSEALFRLFQKTVSREPAKPPEIRIVRQSRKPVPPPEIIPERTVPDDSRVVDIIPTEGQEDGTFSFYAGWRRRGNDQESPDGSGEQEDFFVFSGAYRFWDAFQRSYTQARVLTRIRKIGGPVIGAEASCSRIPVCFPFNWRVTGQVFWQRPESFIEGDTEWSAGLTASAFRSWEIGPETSHLAAASVFARCLSLKDEGKYHPGRVDQDIFTPYKADHQAGLRIGDTLSHRPWLDTVWYAGGRVGLNEDFNPFEPDHAVFRAGWRQLAGAFQFHGGYRWIHYFQDGDRETSGNEHHLAGEVRWETWLKKRHRFEVSLKLNHEIESGGLTGMINFSWHYGNGRGYRDFRGSEVGFRELRTREYHRRDDS